MISSHLNDSKLRKVSRKNKIPQDFDKWDREKCFNLLKENEKNHLAHYKLAVIAFEQNNIDQALEHLLRTNQISPDFLQEKVNLGIAEIYFYQQNWEKALYYYKQLYKTNYKKYEALISIGKCFKKLKNFESAIKTYENAINNNTNKDYLCFYKLAVLKQKENKLNEAIDNYQKALSLNSKNIKILNKLAQTHLESVDVDEEEEEQQHMQDAIMYLTQAIQIDENNYDSLILLAKYNDKKNDVEAAIKFAQEAVKQPSSSVNSMYYLGSLYFKDKQLDQAVVCYKKVLNQDQQHLLGLIDYATILSLQGDFDKSKKYFRIALKIEPTSVICNLRLGKIYLKKLKDIDNAIECYQNVIAAEPNYSKVHYQLGIAYIEKKDYKKATEYLKQCIYINPSYAPAWKAIGNIFYECNSPEKALKYFQKALQLDENDIDNKIGIGNCHYLHENYDQAISAYLEILKIHKNEEVEYNLANCYYMKGDMESSIEHYKNSLSIKKNKPECLYNLGNAYCSLEKYQDALQCFQECVEQDANNSFAIYNQAIIYYVLNQYDQCFIFFENAISKDPNNQQWRNYVANVYMDQGEYQKALNHLQESYNISSNSFEAVFLLSQIHHKLNNLQEASQYIKIALDLEPENQEAYKLFEQIGQFDNNNNNSNNNLNFNFNSSREYKDHKSIINQRRGSSRQLSTLGLNKQASKESGGEKKNNSSNSINEDSRFLKPKH